MNNIQQVYTQYPHPPAQPTKADISCFLSALPTFASPVNSTSAILLYSYPDSTQTSQLRKHKEIETEKEQEEMTRLANLAYHEKYSTTSQSQPHITLYFLQASRSIRTAWLLEELQLPYKIEFANREGQKAPVAFKEKSGSSLGKFPILRDGEVGDGEIVVSESGAITESVFLSFFSLLLACVCEKSKATQSCVCGTGRRRGDICWWLVGCWNMTRVDSEMLKQNSYLCDHYDISSRLIPSNPYLRSRTQTFIHAAEGTLLIHALAILYFRWSTPQSLNDNMLSELAETEKNMSVSVVADLDWLEGELGSSTGRFLVGDGVTAADCMVLFSVQFIFARELGTKGMEGRWSRIMEWMERCERTETYKKAVERSGYTLFPETT